MHNLLSRVYRSHWIFRLCIVGLITLKSYIKFSPLKLIYNLIRFCKDYLDTKKKRHNPLFINKIEHLDPCLTDKTDSTPVEPIYFYQSNWTARKVFKLKPKMHVDVGSAVNMVGIISQFVPTTMIDIRRLPVKQSGLTFLKGSILKLPFKNGSIESLSSICVVEHIGLGRYGDKLDNFGSEKAIKELKRVIQRGGHLIMTVPIDTECRVYFNAHRAFTPTYLLSLFDKKWELVEQKYLYGYRLQEKYDSSKGFGTGFFLFKRVK